MSPSTTGPTTLLGLLDSVPANRTAVIVPEQNIHISYGELRRQVEAFAEALAASGVSRGDRVGIALPNGLPNIVSFLGASLAGTAAPLNPAYKEDEFRFYLEDTNARVLVLPPEGIDEARRAAGDRVPILTVEMSATGAVSLSGVTQGRPVTPPAIDDVALVLHTSGSTGRPKRVPLSHANLSISARNVARSYGLAPDDVSLCVMPLFHVHGLVASTLATLATGGTVVVPGKFNPLSFWRIARDYGATWYSAVPTLHQLLLARVEAGGAEATRRREAPFHPLVQRVAAAAGHARPRGGIRCARPGSVRHDRGSSPDGVQPAPAGRATSGIGRAGNRRANQHHGRRRDAICRPVSAARSAFRVPM